MNRRADAPKLLAKAECMDRMRAGAEVLLEGEQALRRTARRFSACSEDAEDAYQRGVEILLTKAPEPSGEAGLLPWMQVVVRREALAVRRDRMRLMAAPMPDPESLGSATPGPDAALQASGRSAAAAQKLAELKPQERRAIGLQAAGCSYAEIQAITGWSYTKVNRCLAEGRAALREREALPPAA